MKLQLLQIKLLPNYSNHDLRKAAAKRLHIHQQDIITIKITRRSIDARDRFKGKIYYIINAEVIINKTLNLKNLWQVNEISVSETDKEIPHLSHNKAKDRPLIIGTGPGGLFTALSLAENGFKPIIFERGKRINERSLDVGLFWGKGILNSESNVLYGEGGAGTFSDGKINTRSKDKKRTYKVREEFYHAGAREEVLYDAAFHIGSDRLKNIIIKIRKKIEELGGTFFFNTRVTNLIIDNNQLCGVVAANKEYISNCCFLATGHSAHDIYQLLENKGSKLEAKPFATGVRVEIPQKAVDISQYGSTAYQSTLGAAPFSLTYNKSCYTFCMCPGGSIIPCSTEKGSLFTNGMSLSTRNGKMANAAFLLPQSFNTFKEGINHIRTLEENAYNISTEKFMLPLTTLSNFPYACNKLPEQRSCKRTIPTDFTNILPEKMCNDLKEFIPAMLNKLKGINPEEAIIVGPETRSSAPVRIPRKKTLESVQISGLYPVGEGSGYAGGIMSSAIDGLKAAESYINS